MSKHKSKRRRISIDSSQPGILPSYDNTTLLVDNHTLVSTEDLDDIALSSDDDSWGFSSFFDMDR